MTVAAPSGVVTFLFTDVEGSTRRWEADADGMRLALAAHDEVLRGAIETHGGWLFKHTGDGVCAAFASPKSAVDAAVAAQRKLELPVRMGIATGEAELREGDYFGAVLNRAARVMAAGHGGQILLAESTAGLLSGVDLVDLGPRRLRDLPTPIQVFQVQADGLRTEFPSLRGVDESRKFASGDHELDRPRRRGLQSSSGPALASVGDIGGRRWSWQDAACVGSRDAVSRRICRRGMGFRVGGGR
jgi:class 3 adenylate cyclase